MIYDGVTINDNSFIGPCVVFTNDQYPKNRWCKDKDFQLNKTLVCNNVTIVTNSIILSNIIIGKHNVIGVGSVIKKMLLHPQKFMFCQQN